MKDDPTQPQTRPYRVIVCDDSPDLRTLVSLTLEQAGYEVETARDGVDVLRLLRHSVVDLLLLDLSMPAVDGFAVLDYVYEHRPGLPVIVVTGLPPEEIQARLSRMRRHDLPPMILKPFDTDQLLALVEMLRERPGLTMDPAIAQEDAQKPPAGIS